MQYTQQGKKRTIYTKILVGADGAFSTVRGKISLDSPNPKTYISIQEYYKMGNSLPYFSAIFDSDITDFYSFRSAYALANAIQQRPDNIIAEYYRNTNKLRLNIKRKHLKSPFMYNAFLRKIAMKSGLMSMGMINIIE